MNIITVNFNLDDLTLIQLVKLGDVLCTVSGSGLDAVKEQIENVFISELRTLTPEQQKELYHLLNSDIIL